MLYHLIHAFNLCKDGGTVVPSQSGFPGTLGDKEGIIWITRADGHRSEVDWSNSGLSEFTSSAGTSEATAS